MKKIFFPFLFAALTFIACKKSKSSNTGGQSTNVTVTFTNNDLFPKRVILTGTGTGDTLYPFPDKILDIDVQPKSSVTKNDILPGKRKLVVVINCTAQQPVNASCSGYVYRNAEYLAGKIYTELLQ